ncbi:hypothetical protein AGOR_G00169320 [Albula goreensis]|uniref:Peptide deformylase n=1 Tax=Albula goreensis TaxID=1534307 RepID=A0A8T3CXJ0_9TELE|nr:hypothetical protein AGOR_G00169320 [Albula goreensis]
MTSTLCASILWPWVLRRGTHRAAILTSAPLWRLTSATPILSRSHSSNIKELSYLKYLKQKIKPSEGPPYSHVCQVGDPVLRVRAAEVEPGAVLGEEVQRVISTLVKVMRKVECMGLSAPQIGVPMRILAMEYPERMLKDIPPTIRQARGLVPIPLRVFINPQLRICDSRQNVFLEGCESISGFAACVPRYHSVEVSGLNEKAEAVTWQVSGWPARIVQHEMDHMDGVLYTDRMDSRTFINVRWEEYQ